MLFAFRSVGRVTVAPLPSVRKLLRSSAETSISFAVSVPVISAVALWFVMFAPTAAATLMLCDCVALWSIGCPVAPCPALPVAAPLAVGELGAAGA